MVEEATEALLAISHAEIGIVCLHSLSEEYLESAQVQAECLNLPRDDRQTAVEGFRDWLERANPDVLVMNDVPSIEDYWPYVPARIRIIVVLHDHAFGWIKGPIGYARSLDAIIPVSKFVEREVASKLKRYDGIFRTVENGTRYPPVSDRTSTNGPLKLVFMGAIDRQKGAYDLPKILAQCHELGLEIRLTIIGGVSDELAGAFAGAQVERFVDWAGRLPREECFEALAKGDVFLMLSRGEPFGLVTVEAMSMGCVPIGYRVGGTPDIVEDGVSGCLTPLCSYGEIARWIQRLDEDRPLLKRLRDAGIKRSRQHYTAARMAEDYLDVIEDVLGATRMSVRLDPKKFQLPRQSSRRYARFVPSRVRRIISVWISRFPALENYLRKFKGV